MNEKNIDLCIDKFYPKENLEITEINHQENKILSKR
jgi:hypothetical protein